jgi:peptide chain release factor 2
VSAQERHPEGQAEAKPEGQAEAKLEGQTTGDASNHHEVIAGSKTPGLDTSIKWRDDVPERLKDVAGLSHLLESIEAVKDVSRLNSRKSELEVAASDPDLWNDSENAQRVTSELSRVNSELNHLGKLRRRVEEMPLLFEMALEENDEKAYNDALAEVDSARSEISSLEIETLLNGEYDHRNALVTIRSEAGGVDAADWAEMVMRMFLRYCEKKSYQVQILDTSYGEEAGIKSVTFKVEGPYAYGSLSVEQGTHRLVRISPFDSNSRRHTSFAGVEVVPVVEKSDAIEIDEKDLRIDVYRSSGPGGQGVNTTDSAVRITHIPTGIVVSCQNERSQLQNKATALAVLQSKLLERRHAEEQAKIDALKGDSGGSWGNQIRSYVLHPYQMVKDHRTDYETGNTQAVLDGDLSGFIDAGIRWRRTR